MANPNRDNKPEIELSDQRVLNKSFDREYDVLAVEALVYNPVTGELDRMEQPSAVLTTRIDEASATVTYIGTAIPGTATSAASWQVKKIDTTSGTSITFADGNADYDNIWDDRASITYS